MPLTKIKSLVAAEYLPAVVKHLKSVGWIIEYYAIHPKRGVLVRKWIKLNVLRKRMPVSEFKTHANQIVTQINIKLAGGWSPFFESDNIRLYTSVDAVIAAYIQEKEKELRPATLRSYGSFCRMLSQWCKQRYPNMYLSMFSQQIAVQYLDYIYHKDKVGVRTWNNHLKMGRAFFEWAKNKFYTKENPFATIKAKRNPTKKRILIPENSRAQITDYLLRTGNKSYLTVCRIVFTSLIRPKELRLVQIKDVDLCNKIIYINEEKSKTHYSRSCALNKQIYDDLVAMNLDRYPGDYYLFGGKDMMPSKNLCSESKFRREWDKVRRALKLPIEMQLYSFRDTGINNLLKSGIDALTVMQHADHHDLSMTTKYANHQNTHLIDTIYNNAPDF